MKKRKVEEVASAAIVMVSSTDMARFDQVPYAMGKSSLGMTRHNWK